MSKKPSKAPVYVIQCCAFCGRTQYQVPLLIQGPAIGFQSRIHICSECVEVCAAIINERAPKDSQAGPDLTDDDAKREA